MTSILIQILFWSDKFSQAYDLETLMTRMLLKQMIEQVSSSVEPKSLEAAVLKLNNLQLSIDLP